MLGYLDIYLKGKENSMIDFQIGKCYYGFCLKECAEINDIHSKGYLFEHI